MKNRYPIGTLVHHSIFGVGVIVKMREDDNYFVNWTQTGDITIYKGSYIDVVVDNYKRICEDKIDGKNI